MKIKKYIENFMIGAISILMFGMLGFLVWMVGGGLFQDYGIWGIIVGILFIPLCIFIGKVVRG